MDISDLLSQGVDLMLLGMGMVFFILGLLIVVLKTTSSFIMRSEPEPAQHNFSFGKVAKIDDDVVAAITIAVERFRTK